MAGFAAEKAQANHRAGELSMRLRDTFVEIRRFKTAIVDNMTEQEVQDLGFTPAEVTTIRAAAVDMDKLARIAVGEEIQAAPSDFLFHARDLTGFQ